MSDKNTHENGYRITIEELQPKSAIPKTIQFEFQDREDLFNIIDNLKQNSGLEEVQATKIGVSLRLLGPILMANRKHPLFIDFMPYFKNFMLLLKNTVKKSPTNK
ncbi:DUF3861 domain-containing protein [Photobacterium andalusiense]|uniref:DUF3861 domain-containing protein n=1 Tax=Photobacterium andalusiense TaxID=2204296 RepID=A0A1Y6M8W5_9GAMM|nr:DUF3861 domain-containing protein [Photobacterium andalusiense]SMY32975.1 hypothetical protein PAND9192_00703 [Photobacterium andalusiense]